MAMLEWVVLQHKLIDLHHGPPLRLPSPAHSSMASHLEPWHPAGCLVLKHCAILFLAGIGSVAGTGSVAHTGSVAGIGSVVRTGSVAGIESVVRTGSVAGGSESVAGIVSVAPAHW
jgi:hypothetical protein